MRKKVPCCRPGAAPGPFPCLDGSVFTLHTAGGGPGHSVVNHQGRVSRSGKCGFCSENTQHPKDSLEGLR